MPPALVVRIVFWLWLGVAYFAGRDGWLQQLPRFGIQGVVAGLTALLLAAYFRISSARRWVNQLELRTLVLVHLTRFVGVYFLILFQRGELPRAFAVPGGIGDLIVATMALPVAFAPLTAESRRRAIVIWNVAALVDLLLVILTATNLLIENPAQMTALSTLPLSLLPTFLVPLLLATHVVIYVRTQRNPSVP